MFGGVKNLSRDFLQDAAKVPVIVPVTVAFLCGVWAGYTWPAGRMMIGIAAAGLLAGAGFFCWRRHWTGARRVFWVVAFLAAGYLRSADEVHRINADFRRVESAADAFTIVCKVAEVPSVQELKGRAARYSFKASQVRLAQSGGRITAPVRVNWYGAREGVAGAVPVCGECWQFEGRMYRVKSRRGDPELVINSGESRSTRLRAMDAGAIAGRIAGLRAEAARRIIIGIEDWKDVADIHQAVLLGYKNKLSRPMRDAFAWSGTIHVFAISGLHIALIASVFVFFVSSCGVPRYYWIYLLGPLLLIYTVATGVRPSAVRACLMALFYFSAPVFGRRFNALAALAAAALTVHLFTPAYIFDLGCILSFSVMLGLIVLFKPLSDLLKMVFRIEDREIQARLYQVAGDLRKAARLKGEIRFLTFMAELLGVTIAAWLASVPLSAWYFQRITPGGMIANMIITPCALMVVTAGVLGFAASYVSTWLAACFNNAAGFFTTIMIKTAVLISGCPLAQFEVKKWPLAGVWLWFAALLMLAWLLRRYTTRACGSDLSWLDAGSGGTRG